MQANESEAAFVPARLLTLLEVANLLRLSPHTVRAMVKRPSQAYSYLPQTVVHA